MSKDAKSFIKELERIRPRQDLVTRQKEKATALYDKLKIDLGLPIFKEQNAEEKYRDIIIAAGNDEEKFFEEIFFFTADCLQKEGEQKSTRRSEIIVLIETQLLKYQESRNKEEVGKTEALEELSGCGILKRFFEENIFGILDIQKHFDKLNAQCKRYFSLDEKDIQEINTSKVRNLSSLQEIMQHEAELFESLNKIRTKQLDYWAERAHIGTWQTQFVTLLTQKASEIEQAIYKQWQSVRPGEEKRFAQESLASARRDSAPAGSGSFDVVSKHFREQINLDDFPCTDLKSPFSSIPYSATIGDLHACLLKWHAFLGRRGFTLFPRYLHRAFLESHAALNGSIAFEWEENKQRKITIPSPNGDSEVKFRPDFSRLPYTDSKITRDLKEAHKKFVASLEELAITPRGRKGLARCIGDGYVDRETGNDLCRLEYSYICIRKGLKEVENMSNHGWPFVYMMEAAAHILKKNLSEDQALEEFLNIGYNNVGLFSLYQDHFEDGTSFSSSDELYRSQGASFTKFRICLARKVVSLQYVVERYNLVKSSFLLLDYDLARDGSLIKYKHAQSGFAEARWLAEYLGVKNIDFDTRDGVMRTIDSIGVIMRVHRQKNTLSRLYSAGPEAAALDPERRLAAFVQNAKAEIKKEAEKKEGVVKAQALRIQYTLEWEKIIRGINPIWLFIWCREWEFATRPVQLKGDGIFTAFAEGHYLCKLPPEKSGEDPKPFPQEKYPNIHVLDNTLGKGLDPVSGLQNIFGEHPYFEMDNISNYRLTLEIRPAISLAEYKRALAIMKEVNSFVKADLQFKELLPVFELEEFKEVKDELTPTQQEDLEHDLRLWGASWFEKQTMAIEVLNEHKNEGDVPLELKKQEGFNISQAVPLDIIKANLLQIIERGMALHISSDLYQDEKLSIVKKWNPQIPEAAPEQKKISPLPLPPPPVRLSSSPIGVFPPLPKIEISKELKEFKALIKISTRISEKILSLRIISEERPAFTGDLKQKLKDLLKIEQQIQEKGRVASRSKKRTCTYFQDSEWPIPENFALILEQIYKCVKSIEFFLAPDLKSLDKDLSSQAFKGSENQEKYKDIIVPDWNKDGGYKKVEAELGIEYRQQITNVNRLYADILKLWQPTASAPTFS